MKNAPDNYRSRPMDSHSNSNLSTQSTPTKQNSTALLLDVALFLLIVAPRLVFFSPQIDSWDAVDFALGLHSFDLTLYQPHFPGYPVLLFFAKLLSLLGLSDATALALPGTLGLGASLIFLRRALDSLQYNGAAIALLLSSLPIVMLFSGRPMSDALGLSFLLSALAAGLVGRWWWLGLLLALSLGVRLSYAPLALSVFFILWLDKKPGALRALSLGFLLGVFAWGAPLVLLQGFTSLWQEGLRFVAGHFTRWGGAVDENTNWASRSWQLLWNFWAYGMGGLWPRDGLSFWRGIASLSSIACLAALGLALRDRRARWIFAVLFVPYGLWVCLGQNPESPRHMLPLLALFVGAAGLSLGRLAALCALGFWCVSLPLLREQAERPAPQLALSQYVSQNFREARFYGWKTTRVMQYHASHIETKLMRSLPLMVKDLKEYPTQTIILFESKLSEKRRRDRCFEVVESFRRSRYLEPSYESITLFRDCGEAK
jgi:hypothetical protein